MVRAENGLQCVEFKPFWLDNPEIPQAEDPATGDFETDLLVVGGGFTGLWAAVQAKEQNPNRAVALLEAKEIANGATGRPGAIVSTSVMHGLSNAERVFPKDIAELEALGRDNFDAFSRTLSQYEIDCDQEWGGELTAALNQQGLEILREEYDSHLRHGHEVELLGAEEMGDQIRSPLFKGGMWCKKRSGTLHPAKLAWGLKRTARELGVDIYENTALHKVMRRNGGIAVETSTGTIVRARKVLLATNAFAAGHKRIRSRVAAIRDRIIATEPLSPDQLNSIGWENRQGIYDTRTQMNYMRLTKDNRIIFGGRLGYYFGDNTNPAQERTTEPFERLAGQFFQTFPQLSDVSFTHAWGGPIGLTTRMAVHFQKYFGGNVVYAGGYSGFGVTATRFGARIGLAILDKTELPELQLDFARTKPNYIPPEPFRWFGAKITIYAVDTQEELGGWRTPWIKAVEKLGFPLTPW